MRERRCAFIALADGSSDAKVSRPQSYILHIINCSLIVCIRRN
jgi:hypothetical protein